jgi:hypothetical protein
MYALCMEKKSIHFRHLKPNVRQSCSCAGCEFMWGCRDVASLIFNLGTRWSCRQAQIGSFSIGNLWELDQQKQQDSDGKRMFRKVESKKLEGKS